MRSRSPRAIARGEICIALASIARPSPGFVDPLVAAVRGGVRPRRSRARDVRRRRARLPRRGGRKPLAARPRARASRTRLRSTASPLRASSGSRPCPLSTPSRATTSCTSRAPPGSLAVVPDARCRRRTIGPPASVIVCTQDRPDEMLPCVEALLAAGADEIVVVDNGSGEPLALPDGVKLVREPVARPVARPQHRRRGGDARRARLPRRRRAARARLARAPPRRLRRRERHGRRRPDPRPLAPGAHARLAAGPVDELLLDPLARRRRPDVAARRLLRRQLGRPPLGARRGRRLRAPLGRVRERPARRRGDRGRAADRRRAARASRATPRAPRSAIASTPAAATRAGSRFASTATASRMPWIEAGFAEPSQELAERLARQALERLNELVRLEGTLDPDQALALCANAPLPLDRRSRRPARSAPPSARWPRSGIAQAGVGGAVLLAPERAARGLRRQAARAPLRRRAARARHRAGVQRGGRDRARRRRPDRQRLQVVLLDNESHRPHRRARPQGRRRRRDVRRATASRCNAQLERFEQIAAEHDHDWALVCDADEFRESPWPGMTLIEALREVDALGYSAVNFEVFNFRPTDDGFVPGTRRARAPDALRAARELRRDPDQVLAEPGLARRPVRALRRGRALPEPARLPGAVHPAALPDPRRDARPQEGARPSGCRATTRPSARTAGTCSTTASPPARRRSSGIRPRCASGTAAPCAPSCSRRGSHEVLRARPCAASRPSAPRLDVGALGAWLGRTLGRRP